MSHRAADASHHRAKASAPRRNLSLRARRGSSRRRRGVTHAWGERPQSVIRLGPHAARIPVTRGGPHAREKMRRARGAPPDDPRGSTLRVQPSDVAVVSSGVAGRPRGARRRPRLRPPVRGARRGDRTRNLPDRFVDQKNAIVITVGADGYAVRVETEGNAFVCACIARTAQALNYGAVRGGGTAKVSASFSFISQR